MDKGMFPGLKIRPSPNFRGRLIGRLKTVSFMSLSEDQFAKFLIEIESDPLFNKLFLPGGNLPRVIRRNPWPSSSLHKGFYELNEEMIVGSGSINVEAVLEKHHELISTVKSLGQENFERYFLYGEEPRSSSEIAAITGMPLEKIKKIYELMLDLSIESQFSQSSLPAADRGMRYTLIAHIETDKNRIPGINFQMTSPHLARGCYRVNREALIEWERQNALAPDEKKRCKDLIQKIELANMKQNTLLRILETAAFAQSRYFHSQRRSRMQPLTMRRLAAQLVLAPSTISRAVAWRSIKLPWNEEVPLSHLLPSRHDVLLSIFDDTLDRLKRHKFSDAAFACEVEKNFGIRVSRRSVNECRREWEKKQ